LLASPQGDTIMGEAIRWILQQALRGR